MVDALAPLPVVAAGGISDGRGLAAVLLLGATGANIGTRFLATVEASLSNELKQRVVQTPPDGTLRLEHEPAPEVGGTTHTPDDALSLRHDAAIGLDVPSVGQGVGAVRTILTAAEVVSRLVDGAEESLLRAQRLMSVGVAV